MPFDASSAELRAAWRYLGAPENAPDTPVDLHARIEAGLPARLFDQLRNALREIPDRTWAEILAISVSQIKRIRGSDEPLKTDVGSHLVIFALLMVRAEDVLGGRDAALKWFQSEQMALGGRKPIEMLDTYIGAGLVDRVLRQMDYGVYI